MTSFHDIPSAFTSLSANRPALTTSPSKLLPSMPNKRPSRMREVSDNMTPVTGLDSTTALLRAQFPQAPHPAPAGEPPAVPR
jgi:hypothetical protein